ncbi:MAG: hypothetical protein COV52_05240 [Gammaproteobacteria bacterium CG11_big_fil_rev_8_21_14_0_20_46_22]|nr:MAG: hypothetical protein COW05_10015 [Gammaproteobacteria bacterium CG12_big_fil_rev_8_21_14_0_65_46_12]PIR11201.1 MAG: hypothetical protein COV52_05240 [Gammaproteobacteria bacterium CG11_big_fil_rev_8_21_14_0_20_46_22]
MNNNNQFSNQVVLNGSQYFNAVGQYFDVVSPYNDVEAFVDLTSAAAESLPLLARLDLVDFKKHGNDHGYLLIKGLKTDPDLPKTPVTGEEARNRNSYYSETWLAIVANLLGEPFSYKQEGEGYLFHNVRPMKKSSEKLSSESSGILLDFHTETAFHPFMPDFLMLYCLRSDRKKEAKTIVSSTRRFIKSLSEETIAELGKKQFRTGIDYSFGNQSQARGNGPVLSVFYGDDQDPLMTFDPDLMEGLTPSAEKALQELKAAVDFAKEGVLLEGGDLLIVDNRRAVHGRNQFKAYYDGYDRWLQRTYVTRNLLQAEILFNHRERVISYDFYDKHYKVAV